MLLNSILYNAAYLSINILNKITIIIFIEGLIYYTMEA